MDYYGGYSSEYDALFGGLLVVVILASIILGLIAYIISAIIFYNAAKTNGLADIAFLGWIPVANMYLLFALGSTKETYEEIKSEALKMTFIFIGLIVVSFIPFIGILGSIGSVIMSFYYYYRLFYRWTADSGKSIIFVILMLITGSIFFYIYGLMRMKKPFEA